MNNRPSPRFPCHIQIVNSLVNVIWILTSDLLLDRFVPETYRATVSIFKGWFFILVTGLLLALLLHLHQRARGLLERRLGEFIDNLPSILNVFDRDGRAELLNWATTELCGVDRDDYRGMTREELGLAPKAATEHRANYLRIIESGQQ